MKAYKIRVPEIENIDMDFAGKYCTEAEISPFSIYYEIVRPEIHKLVQKHAFELGYSPNECLIDRDGECFTIGDSSNKNQEISWQDFLKLTKDDVMDGTPINLPQNSLENLQPTHKNERNELAWEILKIIVTENYSQMLISSSGKPIDRTNGHVSDAFQYADEFLKQAGKQ